MENLYESWLANPRKLHEVVELEARRLRARALRRHLFEPLVRLCGRLLAIRGMKLLLDPRQAVAQ